MSEDKKKVSAQIVISIISLCLGIFISLTTKIVKHVIDYTETKDNVKTLLVDFDSLRAVPEDIRSVKADVRCLRDSSFGQGSQIAALTRITTSHEARLARIEAQEAVTPTRDDTYTDNPPSSYFVVDGR